MPKFALPVRAVQRAALSEPQLVEQLVEPTVLSCSLLQQRTAEQTIESAVPRRGGGARGGLQGLSQGQWLNSRLWSRQRRFLQLFTVVEEVLVEVFKASPRDRAQQPFVEQTTSSSPALHGRGGGSRGGLQGLSQGQGLYSGLWSRQRRFFSSSRSWRRCSWRSSRSSPRDRFLQRLPVSRPSFRLVEVFMVSLPGQGSTSVSSADRISERTVEQLVDISSGGLSPGVFSASSAGAADEGPAGRASGMGKARFTGDTASRALSSHGKAGFAGEDAPRGSSSRGKAGSTGDDAPRVPFGAQSGVGRHRPRPGQGSTALRGRRFVGQVFVEPDAAGRVGFIESVSVQAELAFGGDFRFSASYRGRFAEEDYVVVLRSVVAHWSVGSLRPGAFLGLRFLSVFPVLVFIAVCDPFNA